MSHPFAAGKTGTTTDTKDVWFSGLTPYYSGSVWLGYYNSSQTVNGNSNLPAGVFGKIMAKAHEGLEVKDLEMPENIVQVSVCQDSGKLPTELCRNDPRGSRTYTELFIKGTEPTTYCETHVKAKVNSSNNKIATENSPASSALERIFIKKDNPNSQTLDYKYILPTDIDDTVSSIVTPPPTTPDDNKTTVTVTAEPKLDDTNK